MYTPTADLRSAPTGRCSPHVDAKDASCRSVQAERNANVQQVQRQNASPDLSCSPDARRLASQFASVGLFRRARAQGQKNVTIRTAALAGTRVDGVGQSGPIQISAIQRQPIRGGNEERGMV